MLWEFVKEALFAVLPFLWGICGDIFWCQGNFAIFIFVVFFHLNTIGHVLIGSFVAVLVLDSFSWFKLHILFADFFITVFDLSTLLVLWRVFVQIPCAIV